MFNLTEEEVFWKAAYLAALAGTIPKDMCAEDALSIARYCADTAVADLRKKKSGPL